jgi:hypothetical protein
MSTEIPSSSFSSRTSALRAVSPGSILPPGCMKVVVWRFLTRSVHPSARTSMAAAILSTGGSISRVVIKILRNNQAAVNYHASADSKAASRTMPTDLRPLHHARRPHG